MPKVHEDETAYEANARSEHRGHPSSLVFGSYPEDSRGPVDGSISAE